jgi:hypothetical protein
MIACKSASAGEEVELTFEMAVHRRLYRGRAHPHAATTRKRPHEPQKRSAEAPELATGGESIQGCFHDPSARGAGLGSPSRTPVESRPTDPKRRLILFAFCCGGLSPIKTAVIPAGRNSKRRKNTRCNSFKGFFLRARSVRKSRISER